MKVKITGHSNGYSFARWWYMEHIGETFDVYPDPKRVEYYYTDIEIKGKPQKHHILKCDAEIVAS